MSVNQNHALKVICNRVLECERNSEGSPLSSASLFSNPHSSTKTAKAGEGHHAESFFPQLLALKNSW